jgi:hypothetical protein
MNTSTKRPGEPLEIPAFYAVLGRKAGDEGIVAVEGPDGALPLVFSNPASLERVGSRLRGVAAITGEELVIVRFTRAEVVRVIKP